MKNINIVFENEDFLVIDKPVGLIVNRSETAKSETLQDWLEEYIPELVSSDSESDFYLSRYRDWETDRKSTRLNSSHSRASRMPSSA